MSPADNILFYGSSEALPDVWAKLQFTGDIFETEDQRNWTDGSFKTYCTPLSRPYLVKINAGESIEQAVTLTLESQIPLPQQTPPANTPAILHLTDRKTLSLPAIGLTNASHNLPLNDREIERLRALSLSHLRAEVKLTETDWKANLARAADTAKQLKVPLEIALFFSRDNEPEIKQLPAFLLDQAAPVSRFLLINDKAPETLKDKLALLRRNLPPEYNKVPIGAGWTLGSIAQLAESEVQSLSYYETTGWRGVMEKETGPRLPTQFPSIPSAVFPLYHIFAAIGEYRGGQCLPLSYTDHQKFSALALKNGKKLRILVANLSGDSQAVRLKNLNGNSRIKQLDKASFEFACKEPGQFRAEPGEEAKAEAGELRLELPPYAFVQVDSQ